MTGYTHNFEPDSRIGRVMATLSQLNGASLREVAEAWGSPSMPDAAVIQQVLRSEVARVHRVKLEVDLRQQRVRAADFVRFKGKKDLADLILAGVATEAIFAAQTAFVLGSDAVE